MAKKKVKNENTEQEVKPKLKFKLFSDPESIFDIIYQESDEDLYIPKKSEKNC